MQASRFYIVLFCVFSIAHALPDSFLRQRAVSCSDAGVKSLISIVRSVASAEASTFCSSYLRYTKPVITITKTTTSTATETSTIKKGTTTVVVTVTQTKPKRSAAAIQPALDVRATISALSADSAGRVSGFPSGIVSGACSCLVPKPTGISTVTTTTTKIVTSTKIITVPVTQTETVTITTTRKPASTTTSSTRRSTSSTTAKTTKTTKPTKASTTSPTASTSTSTSTPSPACTGPDPTFIIQLQPTATPATRTDGNEGKFLGQAPDTYRGTGSGAVLTNVSSPADASIVTLECATSRVKTVKEGWYLNVDYFVSLAPMYFDPEAFVVSQGYQFLQCQISAAASPAVLSCSVEYPTYRTLLETCPEYVQYFDTPVAWGDREYTDGPVCFAKKMVVIPVPV